MTDWLTESLDGVSNCLSRGIAGIDEVIGAVLFPPPTDELSPQDRERIRQSLWRVRRDLADLATPQLLDDISRLLRDAFGGPQGFMNTVRTWAVLVDDLVSQAERDYGGEAGRGPYKSRNVKGALLYLVRRSDINAPSIPPFLAPFVWNFVLDAAITFLAQFSNRNSLWGDVPLKPRFRQRVQAQVQRVGSATEVIAGWLTNVSWSVVFFFSPVSPGLKKRVDEFLAADPQPMRTFLLLATWVAQHTAVIVSLSDLLSTAIAEAQFVVHADDERRKAYARELVLDFIEQETGLPEPDSLGYHLIESLVDAGIEIIATLFEKHNMTPKIRFAT
jgi:hypothetical protein